MCELTITLTLENFFQLQATTGGAVPTGRRAAGEEVKSARAFLDDDDDEDDADQEGDEPGSSSQTCSSYQINCMNGR